MEKTHSRLEEAKDFHFIAKACYRFCRAILGKDKIDAAFIGSSILSKHETLQDSGFFLEDTRKSLFGNNCKSLLNLYRPLDQLEPEKFDVILISEKDSQKNLEIKKILKSRKHSLVFDIDDITHYYRSTLYSIKPENFFSCLNIYKLAFITLLTYLCPQNRNIAEIGVYQGGTTIFMAKMIQKMQKASKVLAFDTFAGIPAPSEKDKSGRFCFDKGMFSDIELQKIKTRLADENVLDQIDVYPGLIEETLGPALSKKGSLFFAFIDTDQYLGTKVGLEKVLESQSKENTFIVLGDTIVEGVHLAIEETLQKHSDLKREKLFTNFELVFSKHLDPIKIA